MSNLETGSLPTAREAPGLHGGFWYRFVAYIIDYLAVNVLFYLLTLVMWMIVWLSGHATIHALESVFGVLCLMAWYLGSIVLIWLYFTLFESSRLQATPGKMALGLVVTDEYGQRIGFGRATGRYFAKILSSLIFCIGYMMAGWTARKQALHDLIAGTCVVRKRGLEDLRSSDRAEFDREKFRDAGLGRRAHCWRSGACRFIFPCNLGRDFDTPVPQLHESGAGGGSRLHRTENPDRSDGLSCEDQGVARSGGHRVT